MEKDNFTEEEKAILKTITFEDFKRYMKIISDAFKKDKKDWWTMEYDVNVKDIIKEVKKSEDYNSIEGIKKRISEKTKFITLNYDKYFGMDFGFNTMKAAIYYGCQSDKDKLEAIEKYLDKRISEYRIKSLDENTKSHKEGVA